MAATATDDPPIIAASNATTSCLADASPPDTNDQSKLDARDTDQA